MRILKYCEGLALQSMWILQSKEDKDSQKEEVANEEEEVATVLPGDSQANPQVNSQWLHLTVSSQT